MFVYAFMSFHSFWSLMSYIIPFLLLLFGQWLSPLWQSIGPRCQILYVSWLLQGVHHPPEQQHRARAGAGTQLRGLWTDTPTVRLHTPSGHEDEWGWRCPLHWGTSQHFRVWVSVCERQSQRDHVWDHHQMRSETTNRNVFLVHTKFSSHHAKLDDTLFNHDRRCFSCCRGFSKSFCCTRVRPIPIQVPPPSPPAHPVCINWPWLKQTVTK